MKRDNESSERYLRKAGIAEGMNVLEFGCGQGEVTKILSDLVGPTGSVLSIDRNRDAIEAASKKIGILGKSNVRFLQGDLHRALDVLREIDLSHFDAFAGRRVLMYLENPHLILKSLRPWLKEKGIVVFEEVETGVLSACSKSLPSHRQAVSWIEKLLLSENADGAIGFKLPSIFTAAGLKFKKIWAEAVIDGQGDQFPLDVMIDLLKPRLETAGVANPTQVDSLKEEIEKERRHDTVFISGMRFIATGCKSDNTCLI